MRRRQSPFQSSADGVVVKEDSVSERQRQYTTKGRVLVLIIGLVVLASIFFLRTINSSNYTNTTNPSPPQQRKRIQHKVLRIPRRLIFTYKYNLLSPTQDDPPFDGSDPLTANVLHTISTYKKYWQIIDLAELSRAGIHSEQDGTENVEQVVVDFLSDVDCIVALEEAEPRLIPHFVNETRGEFKADICRVASLYNVGGYYFDIDIGVVQPVNFDRMKISSTRGTYPRIADLTKEKANHKATGSLVTFSSIYNKQLRFFQAFTAAMPHHPVIKRSLEYMVHYYVGDLDQYLPDFILKDQMKRGGVPSRKTPQGMGAGPYTLNVAFRATGDEEWEDHVQKMLKENDLSKSLHDNTLSIPAKYKYSRFLYETSLQDDAFVKSGIFSSIPLQDAHYKKKVKWCNFVCFDQSEVYFYSRVRGSKGCPLEKSDVTTMES